MPKPLNQNNNSNINLTGKAVKWDGPNIPCLDLCTGDNVTTVVGKIATRVCELVDSYDELQDLDFQCILDYCTSCPQDYSIKAIIQLLLDNDCKINELIQALENQINNINNGGIVLSLNLKCIEDELLLICRDTTTYTINDLLQCFINIICDHENSIQEQGSRLLTLEQLICSLQDIIIDGEYQEPELSNPCIDGGTPHIHHEFTELVAEEVCDVREDLGTTSDVQNAISEACLTDFLTNPDIIRNPTNIAQDEFNKWIIICSALERLKDIENNCCSPTCDDIKIGFSAEYDENSNEYTLLFNNGTGTFIPPGFTDCGSTITLSDQHNNILTVNITITNAATIVISAGSLFVTDPITAKINTCFEHTNGLQCVDCFIQTIPAQELGCKICKLCAIGDDDAQILVTYHTLADATPVTVTLYGGACITFDLPDEAPTIDYIVVLSGSITLQVDEDTDCGEIILPDPIESTCWFFELPVETRNIGLLVGAIECVAPSSVLLALESCGIILPKYKTLVTSQGTYTISGDIFSYDVNIVDVDVHTQLPLDLPAIVSDSDSCISNYYDVAIPNAASETGDTVCFGTTVVGGKVGFYLELIGQIPGDIPEIEIVSAENTSYWIKGQVNDCNCP